MATHAIYRDEKQLIQSVQEATDELNALFEADRDMTEAAGSAIGPSGPVPDGNRTKLID
jgi:hypothetical protein